MLFKVIALSAFSNLTFVHKYDRENSSGTISTENNVKTGLKYKRKNINTIPKNVSITKCIGSSERYPCKVEVTPSFDIVSPVLFE
jgi:hypothetical protein